MAKQECNAAEDRSEVAVSLIRHLTVGYASTLPDYQHVAALNMKGKWLEAAGFTTGTEVDVRVMAGCLVITAREPEPQLMKSLRKVCKFSGRKQQQVEAFIGAMAGK